MKDQKKRPLWQTIIEVCIWLLPFALLGVMLVMKQSSSDYEAIKGCFILTGIVMTGLGIPLRLLTDDYLNPTLHAIGLSLFWGGAIVLMGANLIFGQGQMTEPVQTETFSESLRSFVLSFVTMEQVFWFVIGVAVINGALVLYFVVKLILSIKWEDMYSIGQYGVRTLAFGGSLAFIIYVLCSV